MAETPNAHTEVPGGGHTTFPPFNSAYFASQLFWLTVTFVALYLLMARVGLPRVGAIIDARRARIDGDLSAAAKLKADAETAMESYEKALADARGRAQTIAGETRHRLNAEADEARKALEATLNGKLAEAERAIADTKNRAMGNVKSIAADAASAIVSKLTGIAPTEHAVTEAVNAVLKR